MSDAEFRALAQFRYDLRRFLHFAEERARAVGLTPAQYQLLLVVRGWDADAHPAIADVAERLQLRHHSAVELVQRAEAAGLVTTRVDPDDGRRHQLHLTAKGARDVGVVARQNRDELRRFRAEMADALGELG
jgi:DNA-binding MarR family transcriptional regulator